MPHRRARPPRIRPNGRFGLELFRSGERRILRRVARGAALGSVLSDIARLYERRAPGALCSVLLLEGRRMRHGAAPSLPRAYVKAIDGLPIGPRVGSCGTAMHYGRPVIVESIATDPLWAPYRPTALRHGLRACWSVPIRSSAGEVLGSFAVYYRRPARPERAELAFIGTAAHVAGIAIQRARDEEALRSSEARFRRLSEANIIGVFFAGLDGSIRAANDAFLTLVGRSRRELASGLRWDRLAAPECASADRRALRELRRRGACAPHETEYVRKDGRRVPVLVGCALLEKGSSDLVAFALDLTERRRLEQRIVELGAEERRRVGRELHDGVGQELAGAAYLLEDAGQELGDRKEAAQVRRVQGILAEAMRQVRELARGVDPVEPRPEGLSAALGRLAAWTREVYRVDCRLRLSGRPAVADASRAVHLYRIAQEAVTNAARHGRPRRIGLLLAQRDGRLRLEVADDGRGGARGSDSGVGLATMSHRARLLGGSLELRRAPGGGTIVACSCPASA